MGISFFFYKNLRSWFKQYKLPVQCTLTQAVQYASPGQDQIRYCHRCLHTQSSKYKQLRMYNRKGSLVYGVITAIMT